MIVFFTAIVVICPFRKVYCYKIINDLCLIDFKLLNTIGVICSWIMSIYHKSMLQFTIFTFYIII